MVRAIASLCGVLLCASLGWTQPTGATWKAGLAKVTITPEQFMWMSGYASRDKPAEGKVHDLWAKALVLEDPTGKRSVLVTLDLVGIPRDLSEPVCREIETKYKLPRASIALSTSHTHCGPVVRSNLSTMYTLEPAQQKLVEAYGNTLQKKIVQVVGDALAQLKPAQLTWNVGQSDFAVNRRNNKEPEVPELRKANALKGPIDHDVPVLAVHSGEGKLVGIVFGYACHATVLSFFQWCGDYPGYAQVALEKANPGAQAMFFAGCGADQNPLPRRTVALAEEYGQKLATSVQAVLSKPMKPITGNLGTSYVELELPFDELPNRDALLKASTGTNKYEALRAKLLLDELAKNGKLRKHYPYPVQAWQLGKEVTLVTLGGEVVVDYSLRLKKELADSSLWVMGYANDVMAYIPSLRVLKEGGYEGASSMIYYGLPTVWGPKVEELIVTSVHERVKAARAGGK